MMGTLRHRQAGTTLVIGMILLVLLTLVAVTSWTLGKGQMQIVGNMQFQSEAEAAAQQALEQVISKLDFADHPGAVFASPCAGANTICYDTTGDGVADITVTIKSRSDATKPACIMARGIKNAGLDMTNEYDAGCSSSAVQLFGLAGAVTGDSLCADSLWDIQAEAVDNVSRAKATVTEGISVRVSTDAIITSCP